MNETTRLLLDTAERIFKDRCAKNVVDAAERGEWPEALWNAIAESGVLLAAVPEAAGGAGLSFGEALALLRPAGRYAAPLPIAETMLGGALLAHAGLKIPDGPLSLVVAEEGDDLRAEIAGGALHLSGGVAGAPWARGAACIVVALPGGEGAHIGCVNAGSATIEAGVNMAGEPRDSVRFDGIALGADAWGVARTIRDPHGLAALARTVLMAGALESILAMSVQYSLDRTQFGRPIAKFQAVQQQMAVLAGETAAAIRASDSAAEAFGSVHESTEIAVAKARVGEAAGKGAAIAHQVHGAMGFTHEHPLHQRTRRLWSWRDEYGNEARWNAELGRRIAAVGADRIWAFVTRSDA